MEQTQTTFAADDIYMQKAQEECLPVHKLFYNVSHYAGATFGSIRGILNPRAFLGFVLDGEADVRKRLVLLPPTTLYFRVDVGISSRSILSTTHPWVVGNMFLTHQIYITFRYLPTTRRLCDRKYVNEVADAIPLNCLRSV
jgi:hypothetical protein